VSYTLHPEAEAELMEAAVYLAEHVSRGVANAFLDEFERVASLVDLFPKLGTPEGEEYRTYPLSKYKSSLVYFETDTGPLILAVAPHKREPGYWKTRQPSD
jgi:plasmid stabilization system protein ParE